MPINPFCKYGLLKGSSDYNVKSYCDIGSCYDVVRGLTSKHNDVISVL